jgi:hypothetical protein
MSNALCLILLQTDSRVGLDEVKVHLVTEELTNVADGIPSG